ncbi:MAG: type II toxin-antitoxin system VapC family toxin [Chloroflexi bacterium]|nr:type II toxin-antitoxin system VapC family toxin [Chloroflexota bacterium]
MIVPDTNLLLYAHYDGFAEHDAARLWWEDLVNGFERVGIAWAVSAGFVRVITNPRAVRRPPAPAQAVDFVRGWFEFPHITPLNPGAEHLTFMREHLVAVGVGGNLVTDAHIAALAMEYQAEVHSADMDFGRFPGLRWRNPL